MASTAWSLPASHSLDCSSPACLKPMPYDTPDDLDHLFRVCTTLNDPPTSSLSWLESASPLLEDADEDHIEYTFATLEDLPQRGRREPLAPVDSMQPLAWPPVGHGLPGPSVLATAQQTAQPNEADGLVYDEEDEYDFDESPPFDLPELDYAEVESAPGTPLPDRELDVDLQSTSDAPSYLHSDGASTPRAHAADSIAATFDGSEYGFDFTLNGDASASDHTFDWSAYPSKPKDPFCGSSDLMMHQQGDIADAEWELALAYASGDTVMDQGPYDPAGWFGPPPGLEQVLDQRGCNPDDGRTVASGSGANEPLLPFDCSGQQTAQLHSPYHQHVPIAESHFGNTVDPHPASWLSFDPTGSNPFACSPVPVETASGLVPPMLMMNPLPNAVVTERQIEPLPTTWVNDIIRASVSDATPCSSMKSDTLGSVMGHAISGTTIAPLSTPVLDAVSIDVTDFAALHPETPAPPLAASVKAKKSSHHGRSVRKIATTSPHNQNGKVKSSVTIDSTKKKRNRAPERPKTLQCPHCPRSFSRPYNLKSHQETHSGLRKHICPVCLHLNGEDLSQNYDVDDDEHTVEQRGQGLVKKYARKHDLARHLDAVHEDFLWKLGIGLQEASQEGWRVPKGTR